MANMAMVLNRPKNDSCVETLARQSVMEYAVYASSIMDYYRNSSYAIMSQTDLDDPNGYLDQALGQRKGVIFATGHFGNWDIAGAIIASRRPLWVIQESFAAPRINEILRRIRESKNMKSVQMNDSLLPLLRGLLRGESVGVMIDRPTPGKGVEVDLFGSSIMVPDGIGRLAVRAEVPVLVGGAIRERDGRHTLVVRGTVCPREAHTEEENIQQITQDVFVHFEHLIRRVPHQWYMFRKMWLS